MTRFIVLNFGIAFLCTANFVQHKLTHRLVLGHDLHWLPLTELAQVNRQEAAQLQPVGGDVAPVLPDVPGVHVILGQDDAGGVGSVVKPAAALLCWHGVACRQASTAGQQHTEAVNGRQLCEQVHIRCLARPIGTKADQLPLSCSAPFPGDAEHSTYTLLLACLPAPLCSFRGSQAWLTAMLPV